MNIGIVTTWFERGAALVSRAYMETLSQQHKVFIYARGGEAYAQGDPRWDLPNVTWGKRVEPILGTDIDWPDFERWGRQKALDVVLFNEQHYWQAILKSLHLKVPIGAYVDYYTEETVPFFELYDFLLCNTQRHYSVFERHPQAIYIPWGTDCTVFAPQVRTRKANGVTFFHSAGMGGINLRKGTDILVRAFQKVRGEARLIIHSQVGLDRYGEVAETIASDVRIEFINRTVGAPGLYHLGDVYVYPTRLEGIGLTIPEALACGLPVVTTDEAPMNEFVLNNVTGRLIPVAERHKREDGYYWPESTCSETALTEAMQVYVDNPQLVTEHGQQARAHAVQNLDWAKNSQNLADRVTTLKVLQSRSATLKRQVLAYERRRMRPNYIALAFLTHQKGDFAAGRRYLLRAILHEPKHLRNLGVWSIACELFLGKYRAGTLRRLIRTVRGVQ